MGKRGPAPRPTHLRALEGVRDSRLNHDEPVPAEGLIVPPTELDADAQAVWNRLAPDLIAKRVLTAWDVDSFAAFCRSVALYNRASIAAAQEPLKVPGSHNGTIKSPVFEVASKAAADMRAFGQRFGLTPGDRAQLKVNDDGGRRSNAAAYIV